LISTFDPADRRDEVSGEMPDVIKAREIGGPHGDLGAGRTLLHPGGRRFATMGVAADEDERRALARQFALLFPARSRTSPGDDAGFTLHPGSWALPERSVKTVGPIGSGGSTYLEKK